MGALIDVNLFEKISLMENEFHRMTDELANTYMEVDPEVAVSEIQKAIETLKQQ